MTSPHTTGLSRRFSSRVLPVLALLVSAACRVGPAEPPSLASTAVGAPASLKTVAVPRTPGLNTYVKDEAAAVALGKALFWDQATGSDGLACASCHFHAGADSRVKNQLNPGRNGRFNRTASGAAGGPNYRMKRGDFPFRHASTDDVLSSQGVYSGTFMDGHNDDQTDICERTPSPTFHVGGIGTRDVEPRNTPTTINAALNFRNFWDGRANNSFNGVDPFGLRNGTARVIDSSGDQVVVRLRNASLASQGVGPAVSNVEMICQGRTFAKFGKKMIARYALSLQAVHGGDSVLGGLRNTSPDLNGGKGLSKTYEELIQAAFHDEYWNTTGEVGNSGFTQMESNFALFWGLALHLYQATLVSDEAPYDRWAEGSPSALTAGQRRGLELFMDKGRCINCHKGPEFTGAATTLQAENQEDGLVERMLMADRDAALYDQGFYNIGVTRTRDDPGVGGEDPWGNPLSFTRQYTSGRFVDDFDVDPCTFEVFFDASGCAVPSPDLAGERTAVDGAFKTPTLRNVELTGPYFHNGSAATLEQVVALYNRGGNFNNPEKDADITRLGLSNAEVRDLVAFMNALTDPRVKYERAPFDHPQLFIPNGHPGNERRTQGGAFGDPKLAQTEWLELAAVGAGGRSTGLETFDATLARGAPNLPIAQRFGYGNTALVLDPVPDRTSRVRDAVAADDRFTARNTGGTPSGRIFYSASGLPTGVRLSPAGVLRGRMTRAGEFLVTVIAYDAQGATAQATFTWTVER